MKLTRGRVFVDERLNMTGGTYLNCTFDGCVLEANPSEQVLHCECCEFRNCQLVGEAWPEWMVRQCQERNSEFG